MTKFVPYLAEKTIEQDTETLLAEYAQASGITIAPPIPIEDIVEKHLKLRLEFNDTHKLFGVPRDPEQEPDILGAMFFDEARIVVDESLDPDENPGKEGRYRFTLAHEGGGHWRLHSAYFKTDPAQSSLFGGRVPPSVVCRSSQAKQRVEWQADFYASCLLMPRDLLFAAWRKTNGTSEPFVFDRHKHTPVDHRRRRNGLRSAGVILEELFQEDCEPYFDQIARQFSPTFLVSPLAMRIRLEQLGLLVRNNSRRQIFADAT